MAHNAKTLQLNRLATGNPGITAAYGESMAEAASVCLDDRGHASGIGMTVSGDYSGRFVISFSTPTPQMKRTWAHEEHATEQGAYGLAALIVEDLTKFRLVERSRKGTGFDYWLSDKSDPGPLFQHKSRLEVSGIRDGSNEHIGDRLRKKTQQIRAVRSHLPGIVVVVEFGEPQSRMVDR
jgi:hypothetical protein